MSSIFRLHQHDGGPLRTVDHEPAIPVLDQEDLFEQGIDTSELVPGAKKVDALGSCVANASTAALSTVLPKVKMTGLGITDNAETCECFAIELYHQLGLTTGDPAREWPPDDCGSSGQAACQYLEHAGLIGGHRIAHDATDICSLMQTGGLMVVQPFLNAWEE